MRHSPPALRHLSLDHLVFYRAFMEGTIDLVELAKRYLETGDSRPAAKRTLRVVQNALIAAARRAGKHGQARLLKLPAAALRAQPGAASTPSTPTTSAPTLDIPSFDDFAAEKDPNGDFSVDELWDIYRTPTVPSPRPPPPDAGAATGPEGPEARRLARNSRLAKKRLQLIADLTPELARPPQPQDDIRAWFDETVTEPLVRQDVLTLEQVVALANTWGHKWERRIPKFGPVRAQRLIDWLAKYQAELGLTLTAYATTPRHQLPKTPRGVALATLPGALASPPSPFAPTRDGLYRPPAVLDGSRGRYRVWPGLLVLDEAPHHGRVVANDYEAILAWLDLLDGVGHVHTQRSYRTAVDRLLLWAAIEKRMALSDLEHAEIADFLAWLANPAPHDTWVGMRNVRRTDPAWRPFLWRADRTAGLSPISVRQTAVILRNLFSWLGRIQYLDRSPFDPLVLPTAPAPRLGQTRQDRADCRFTPHQWQAMLDAADRLPDSDLAVQRLRFLLRLARATRLRPAELANTQAGHLHGALLTVPGKRRQRDIPLPPDVWRHLDHYLAARGLPRDPAQLPAGTPLIAKLYATRDTWAMSPSALYTVLAGFSARCAAGLAGQTDRTSPADDIREGVSSEIGHTASEFVKTYPLESGGADPSQYPQ